MKQIVIALLLTLPAMAAPAQHNRITGRVDNSRRATLKGHIHPLATAANDQGRADAALQLPRVTLVLRPSDAQQADLNNCWRRSRTRLRPTIISGSSPKNTRTASA